MPTEATFEHWVAQARAQLHRLPYALAFISAEPVKTTRPTDSLFDVRLNDIPLYLWLGFLPLALHLVFLYLKGESGELVRYRVPTPSVPKREIIANPTVKV